MNRLGAFLKPSLHLDTRAPSLGNAPRPPPSRFRRRPSAPVNYVLTLPQAGHNLGHMALTLMATVVSVILILVTHGLTSDADPGPALLTGAVAGLAYTVGAWCAPLMRARGGALAGSLFSRWQPAWDRPKALQILAGAVVAAALIILGGTTAVILGIMAAVGVGAFLPLSADGADSEDAQRSR